MKNKDLKEYTAEDLYDAINSYESDSWKDSPEFKELMKRLKTMPIKKLEAQGYIVPGWKYHLKKL